MKFRSGLEKRIFTHAEEQGMELAYEPPNVRIRYSLPRKYIPDFVLPNGVIIEAKGYFTSADRTKMRKIQEQNPELDIRFVFQNPNNRLTKSKNSETYWQWAERLGFPWAENKIPLSWWNKKEDS